MHKKIMAGMAIALFLVSMGTPARAADVKVGGYVQFQFASDESAVDGFDFGDIQLKFTGSLSPTTKFEVELDPKDGTKLLKNAFVDVKGAVGSADLRLGQFKVDFGQENVVSASKRESIYAAPVVTELGPSRDIGLYLNGAASTIGWGVGVFNGEGRNKADANETKDILLRGTIKATPNFTAGASWLNGTKGAGNTFKNRLGFDVVGKAGPLSLQGEYIQGRDGTVNKDGYYAQAVYDLTPSTQFLAKYDAYDPNNAAAGDSKTWVTLGFVQNFGGDALGRLNYVIKNEEGTPASNNVIVAQYQVKF